MATTTASMGLSKPTLNGDSGTWDTSLNATIDAVDAHDHTTGKGVPVPTAGIGINANLTMAGYSLTNLRAACFTVQTSFATNLSLWVRQSDNGLMWRTASGVDRLLADNSGLNLAAIGGITGDYASSVAALYYDDTAQEYRHLEAAPLPNSWSYVGAGGIKLYEHASGISNHVKILSPAALAATYSLTLGAALPGSTAIAQVSSAGAVTYSNTIVNDLTMTANKHVTVSGTGELKHGDRVRSVTAQAGASTNWTPTANYMASGGASLLYVSMPFDTGDRVKSLTFSRYGDASANVTITAYTVSSAMADTPIGSTTLTAPAASWSDTTIDLTDSTLATGESFRITFNASAANIRIGNIRVTYDRP